MLNVIDSHPLYHAHQIPTHTTKTLSMDSVIFAFFPAMISAVQPHPHLPLRPNNKQIFRPRLVLSDSRRWSVALPSVAAGLTDSMPPRDGTYTVGDFMTKKDDLHVVKATTTVEEALETLVEKRITGFPVIDEDWKLVGVVSDYDLLALDSISGAVHADMNLFPTVNSSWKSFNQLQKLISKTNGKVVGDLMTPVPLAVRETTNLEDAVRLLLETKYRRLPVVDGDGKLVGIITRGNIVRAAIQIKFATESKSGPFGSRIELQGP